MPCDIRLFALVYTNMLHCIIWCGCGLAIGWSSSPPMVWYDDDDTVWIASEAHSTPLDYVKRKTSEAHSTPLAYWNVMLCYVCKRKTSEAHSTPLARLDYVEDYRWQYHPYVICLWCVAFHGSMKYLTYVFSILLTGLYSSPLSPNPRCAGAG